MTKFTFPNSIRAACTQQNTKNQNMIVRYTISVCISLLCIETYTTSINVYVYIPEYGTFFTHSVYTIRMRGTFLYAFFNP